MTEINLERELSQLKDDLTEMMLLVHSQLEKSMSSFENKDVALAKEIHRLENHVNAKDLNIDKDCENIIALYNPVASDLRFVLAASKIVSHLERIGDHADKIARYVRKKQIVKPFNKKLLKSIRFHIMFDTALDMMDMSIHAFIQENTEIARQVFAKDVIMNEIYGEASQQIHDFTIKKEIEVESLLYLFSIVNKLERIGDLAVNIAEETIFYVEAKVLRHSKMKKKL